MVGALAATGCATLTAPRTAVLSVNSNVVGADVVVDGARVGEAPAQIELDRKRPAALCVTAPGRVDHMCNTKMKRGGGYIAADIVMCLFLFPLGCISFIDAGGAWNQLENPSCNAVLDLVEARKPGTFGPEDRPAPPPPPSR